MPAVTIAGVTIAPDDKDWTWVLDRPCPDCGLDLSGVDPSDIGSHLRANVAEWPALLDHPAATVRPNDGQWSALEYACHVRDVFRLFAVRLDAMLNEDDPHFPNWDQDATAIEDRYAEQQPEPVAAELAEAGAALAAKFDAVHPDQWTRRGRRSDGAQFTVASLGRYLLHDPVHHVWDVRSAYQRQR
ncbi:MAG: DinB family protein [Microthrixaceae bacterium]